MSNQLGLFEEAKVEIEKPEPRTTVRLGKREALVPIRKQRREAIAQLRDILADLEGKDIYIGTYDAGGQHFWLDNLKILKLQVENLCFGGAAGEIIPSVIVLRGRRDACVRIFTDYLVAVRTQEYQGYWHYLLDFRNGFWQSPVDNFRRHYACLHITKFKE
ncbi:MAG: hypothetical protein PHQ43_01475 [Dehalococcoidales bacterium]|nr:hypothetical protein [Dehalococcoidales bacterium]